MKKKPKINKEASILAHDILREIGVCTRCIGNWTNPGYSLCPMCLEQIRLYGKRKRRERNLVYIPARRA
jgi:hypothetical protein